MPLLCNHQNYRKKILFYGKYITENVVGFGPNLFKSLSGYPISGDTIILECVGINNMVKSCVHTFRNCGYRNVGLTF